MNSYFVFSNVIKHFRGTAMFGISSSKQIIGKDNAIFFNFFKQKEMKVPFKPFLRLVRHFNLP